MKAWHALSVEETREELAKDTQKYGPNELEEIETTRWYTMLARQFTNILILVLILATVLSFFIGDVVDALAILAIIIFNGLLGFVQEWKAETAIKNLKKILSPKCYIIQDDEKKEVDVKDLKPGDCVFLEAGNVVPADIRLSKSINLMINEASLTGESTSISKQTEAVSEQTPLANRKNMAYMGTHVVNGHGRGFVVAIGMDTEFGRIAELTGEIEESKTQLQKQLSVLGRQFGILALAASAVITLLGIMANRDILQMLMTGISLAVSAIPEGLPAVVTIALALGVRAMAKKKALMRRLQAAEALGVVSIICTDKTGTLTKNEMKIEKIWLPDRTIEITGVGYELEGDFKENQKTIDPSSQSDLMALLNTGLKCNHAKINKEKDRFKVEGSPDEAALIAAAVKSGLNQEHKGNITSEFTFDSNRKRMSVIEESKDERVVHVKGAPEVILKLSSHVLIADKKEKLNEKSQKKIEKAYIDFAEQGLRTLALARKTLSKDEVIDIDKAETDLTFLGIAGLLDPPRKAVPDALKKAKAAGIKIIMITGDSPLTAKAIAGQIGLKIEKTLTSSDLQDLSDEQLASLLKKEVLFARTIPKDKFRIVKLLQAQGDLVAMTGDGVNDTPALKQADIGIAMGIRGTDVARSVADIVLSDDNFASIIAAVEEGRRQYDNIRKFVLFLTSSNIGEMLAILINMIAGGPLILIPIQILWINLVTDSASAVSLSIEQAEKDIMERKPRKPEQPIITRLSFFLLGLFGSYIGIMTFILYQFYLNQSQALANTVAFTALVFMSNLHALNFRNLQNPIADIGWFSNKWLLIAILAMLSLQVLAIYLPWLQMILHTVPLSLFEWPVIILAALPLFLIPEFYKWLRKKDDTPTA
ncbi:HAD family hydrolase [Legionella israelensis]|uniref:HAD family hydrolase n=1 Tax=Legionella israelensis TaxID=454 RepID=A0AAX1EF51_9GAMM|nr:HAD-IC family P-type ATPase [Legionella israelensis]QBR83719.1 HAD family hydrolase [Legionella israelensis]